jgi:hypothetical protein
MVVRLSFEFCCRNPRVKHEPFTTPHSVGGRKAPIIHEHGLSLGGYKSVWHPFLPTSSFFDRFRVDIGEKESDPPLHSSSFYGPPELHLNSPPRSETFIYVRCISSLSNAWQLEVILKLTWGQDAMKIEGEKREKWYKRWRQRPSRTPHHLV